MIPDRTLIQFVLCGQIVELRNTNTYSVNGTSWLLTSKTSVFFFLKILESNAQRLQQRLQYRKQEQGIGKLRRRILATTVVVVEGEEYKKVQWASIFYKPTEAWAELRDRIIVAVIEQVKCKRSVREESNSDLIMSWLRDRLGGA